MSGAYQRVLSIPGVSNFRDAGGYETADGARVVRGRLFRAAQVGGVADDGAAHFRRLGIATIVDLRGVEERTWGLPAFAEAHGIRIVSTPIEPASLPALRQLMVDGAATPQAVRGIMLANYRRYAVEETAVVGRALTAVADASDRPVVVHCTAGKDRTGFVIAVILSLLNVPRATVFADYLLSNEAWDRQHRSPRADALSADALAWLLVADARYLDAAFEALEAAHGSVDDFVRAATGDAGFAERLRAKLLVADHDPGS